MLDFIPALLPALSVTLLFLGLYKLFFEKREQAKGNILDTIQQKNYMKGSDGYYLSTDESVLKKRHKNTKSLIYAIERKLEFANMMLKPQEFISISIAAGAVALMFATVSGQQMFISVLIGIFGAFLPYFYLLGRIWYRLKVADRQFAEVLDTMVNCFKTGYGLNRALQTIADKYQDPWGTEFEKLITEINLGLSFEEALANFYERMPTADVELFVSALLLQKDSGGNLGEILANLSKTCRNRYQLFRKVKTLTAQGKMSACFVSVVPFLITGMMFLAIPQPFIEFVSNPIGILLIAVAGVWMLVGYGVLYKLVQIEV